MPVFVLLMTGTINRSIDLSINFISNLIIINSASKSIIYRSFTAVAVNICMYVSMCIYLHMNVCMYIRTYSFIRLPCTSVCICICMHMYNMHVYVYVCTYMYMHVHMNLCYSVFIVIGTEWQNCASEVQQPGECAGTKHQQKSFVRRGGTP